MHSNYPLEVAVAVAETLKVIVMIEHTTASNFKIKQEVAAENTIPKIRSAFS